MKQIYVLDTTAFLLGFDLAKSEAEYFTTVNVEKELKKEGFNIIKFKNMIQNRILKIVLPNKKSIDVVNSIATETGDIGALSDVDINILALGLQLKKMCTQNNVPIVITDDYSIQNLASRLGLKFKSLLTPGIKQKILWTIYCPGCHNTYENTDTKICVMCGTELKRKPVSKTKIKMGRLSI